MASIESVSLDQLTAQLGFAAIIATGTISGQIPVSIDERGITVSSGYVTSDNSGGSIMYSPSTAMPDSADTESELGFVVSALRNFEYDSLRSSITYTPEGQLQASTRLEGISPNLDPDQPIVLNVNMENNVPQLLRSLRGTRSIEEVLERRLGR